MAVAGTYLPRHQTDSPRLLHLAEVSAVPPPLSFPFLSCVCLADQSTVRRRGGERERGREYFSLAPCHVSKRYFRDIYIYIYCLIRREKNGRQRVNLETCCFVIEHSRMFGTDWEEEERMVTFEIFL